MVKKIFSYIKNNFHLSKQSIPYFVGFVVFLSFIFYGVSVLPNQKLEHISNEITEIANQSEEKRVTSYISSNNFFNNEDIENKTTTFNRMNGMIDAERGYRNFVVANLDTTHKTLVFPSFENNKPAIIATSWSTSYLNQQTQTYDLMSGIGVMSLADNFDNKTYNFCYIGQDEADYLISNSNGIYKNYKDLIGEEISCSSMSSSHSFFIRDIILRDYGFYNDLRKDFGSFIVAYYLPLKNETSFSFVYQFGTDNAKTSQVLQNIKTEYSLDEYTMNFLNYSQHSQLFDDFINNFYAIQNGKDLTYFIVPLLMVIIVLFTFLVFDYCENNPKEKLGLGILFFGIFTILYAIMHLLSLNGVLFISKLFTTFGIFLSFLFVIMILCSIYISSLKDNPSKEKKFKEKYIYE